MSAEGSEDVLEDPNDEPTVKKRVSDSEDKVSVEHEVEFIGMCLLIMLSSLLPYLSFFFFFLFYFFIYFLSPLYTHILVSPLCCSLPLSFMSISLITETFEEPGVVLDTKMPTATSIAALIALVFAIFSAPVSAIPMVSIYVVPTSPVPAISTTFTLTDLGVFLSLISFFTSSL